MQRFDSRPAYARASRFEHLFCSTVSLSIFLGENSSDLLQPNAVKVDLDFDDDEIKVGVSFESDQSGDDSLIPKLDGIVTRMRMNFDRSVPLRKKENTVSLRPLHGRLLVQGARCP